MMSKNIVSLRQMKEFKNEKGNLIDISTVGKFETEKYLGEWYEIARYDHRFEKNLKDVMATYILQKNGMIKVVNKGFDKKKGLQKKNCRESEDYRCAWTFASIFLLDILFRLQNIAIGR